MIATNQHWDIRYGQLSQALSMYIEWASTGGCKSGNERNQDVMLRFALLKSIHERVEHKNGNTDDLQDHEREIYDQIKAYAKGEQADPDILRSAIAVSVSQCNLHGGAAAISREDQGGAAKVSSFSFVQDIKNPFLRWAARIGIGLVAIPLGLALGISLVGIPLAIKVKDFVVNQLIDTNNAADSEMNLDATGASKTQAHKGQDEKTREAVHEVLKSDPLFQGKNKLTSAEIKGLQEDKNSRRLVEVPHIERVIEEPSANEEILDKGPKALSKLGGPVKGSQSRLEVQNTSGLGDEVNNADKVDKVVPPQSKNDEVISSPYNGLV